MNKTFYILLIVIVLAGTISIAVLLTMKPKPKLVEDPFKDNPIRPFGQFDSQEQLDEYNKNLRENPYKPTNAPALIQPTRPQNIPADSVFYADNGQGSGDTWFSASTQSAYYPDGTLIDYGSYF